MAEIGFKRWRIITVTVISLVTASMLASADRTLLKEDLAASAAVNVDGDLQNGSFVKFASSLFQTSGSGYEHVWPEMELGWKIVLGSFIGFCGAIFGSAAGVGGGGIFVPMLTLIIGFDPKSATGISKFTSTKAFCKGVATWKKETITKKCAYFKNGLLPFQEAAKCLESNGYSVEVDYKLLPSGPNNGSETKAEESLKQEVDLMKNVCWKEFGLLVFVWIAFLGLQIFKTYTTTCSIWYWVLNLLQVPVSFGVSGYEAVSLYKGSRKISSKGDSNSKLRVGQLIIYCFCGILAGMVGGLLGLGGGLIMGPLFLELGIPPQVSSATATFAMMFSSSMSSVEYYLLKRFPVPYAFYFVVVVTIAASAGQHFVRRLIIFLGRTSLIIFILASIIFISAISLGGVGISNMINDIHRHEYMGFENMCKIEV
ncbi:sulfite exporter TauE/SafE family protein 3 isoform X3 [Lactuca sativa]|uniref:sulfite exporter TauE/SafE family protein 3 isoform X3 n=1 Tax=Lactuca sativa TaxID=4236 RepID=UPI0022AED910|nr:sulfite exporter TauE/SafE family protein 3 isoform X3 [Lactuca sativa]